MSLRFERYYPYLLALAAGAFAWLVGCNLPAGDSLNELLSAAISVSAILVGFLATLKSILMALPAALRIIEDGGYRREFPRYLSAATASNLAFCGLNLTGFFSISSTYATLYCPAWIALATLAASTFWRVSHIMTLAMGASRKP